MLNDISMVIDAKDAPNLNKASHKFKGILTNLAAKEAVNIAYKLEAMAKEGDTSSAPATYAALCWECERIKNFILNYKLGSPIV